jgi:hypothetical protein
VGGTWGRQALLAGLLENIRAVEQFGDSANESPRSSSIENSVVERKSELRFGGRLKG